MELIKYAANAFLATSTTFINEIADIAEKVGADVQEVARGIGLEQSIGSKFLHAGRVNGGSVLPKGTPAQTGEVRAGSRCALRIVEATLRSTKTAKRAMAAEGRQYRSCSSLRGKIIAVLGLTFKRDTNDMREAPSIPW